MPAYAWKCSVCEQSAPAGSDMCANCGAAASLSVVETEQLKRKRQGFEDDPKPEAKSISGPWVIFAGALCIILGFATIINHKWPFMFTPIQLDMIALPLAAIFGQTIGAYLAGSLCLMLGSALLWGALNEKQSDN